MPDESFYTLHDGFKADEPSQSRWRVNSTLVRSIEGWCGQIHALKPIDREVISDRTQVQKHFDNWCAAVFSVHQLDRSSLVESLGEYLLASLRLHPEDPTIRRHWIAYFMHRSIVVGWQVWRLIPQKMRSCDLLHEIILCSHCQIAILDRSNSLLVKFQPAKSQLVSGHKHLTAYIDRQIRYAIFPDLRKLLGEPNFGRSDLGIAARYSRNKVRQALQISQLINTQEYLNLWTCFSTYLSETGIAVNQLVDSDFDQIECQYRQLKQKIQILSTIELEFLANLNVMAQIKEVGKLVRNLMLFQPDSIDEPIDDNRRVIDVIDSKQINPLKYQGDQEQWTIINAQVKVFCRGSQPANLIPSHQQAFWLYYGLELTQTQIAKLFKHNFDKCGNPGSVSRLLYGGRVRLFEQIHIGLDCQIPEITDETDISTIELLEMYFDSAITYYIVSVAGKLGLEIHTQISVSRRIELATILTDWFQEKIMVQIPQEIFQAAISRLIDKYFN